MVSPTGAKIYGIDAAPGLLKLTKERVPEATLMLEDLEEIPFSENSFDLVTGFNSFQYAGDKLSALYQARMVVKTGGGQRGVTEIEQIPQTNGGVAV